MTDTPTPSRETVSDLLQVVTNDPSYGTFVPPPVHETAAVACSRLSDLQDKELRFLAVGLKNQRNPSTYEHRWKALHEYLVTLFHMERADENLIKKKIKGGLEMIVEEKNNFPEAHRTIGKHLINRFDQDNWGVPVVVKDDSAGIETAEGRAGDLPNSSRKRVKLNTGGEIDYTDRHFNSRLRAADDDPIYGAGACMHNILCKLGTTGMKSYILDPKVEARDARIFGHNGLQVGDCWARQVALFRDGGHGILQGGICGTEGNGAYSIIVSGAYHELDQDRGDILYYSGPQSHENTSDVPTNSTGTKAMIRSTQTGHPIRVFRAHTSHWRYAPRGGLRYDGLYKSVAVLVERNRNGGAYKQFKLIRQKDQDPIQRDAPSIALYQQFERVINGYTKTRPAFEDRSEE